MGDTIRDIIQENTAVVFGTETASSNGWFVLLMNVTLLSIMFPQLCTLQSLVSCLLLHVFF